MKKVILLLAFLFFGLNLNTIASHFIGAEISYQKVSASSYEVTLTAYRDCNQTGPVSTLYVEVKAPGCNVGKAILVTLHSQKVSSPFGPAVPVICSGSSQYPFYKIETYKGIINFSAADFACQDWVLSWSDCCRQGMENIVASSATTLYTEAKLKLQANLNNHSPVFDTLNAPLIYVNHGKDYALSVAATDLDGDSLVYSLVTPLSAGNSPVTYTAIPQISTQVFFGTTGHFILNPNPKPPYSNPFNPQIAQLTGGPGLPILYSAQYPMVSIMTNWNGPATIPIQGNPPTYIWAANHYFGLGALNGTLKFNATYYNISTQPGISKNQYLVSVMVEEYRKLNGAYVKIGSVRRETMIKVFSGSQNLNPVVFSPVANNQPLTAGSEIKLRPGAPLTLQFSAADEDSTDVVLLSTNATTILPGASFTATSGNTATGTISWTPTAAHVREQPYYFQILARDNANPLRGVYTETIAVRVSATGSVTGTAESKTENPAFTAFPNPYTNELHFSLNLTSKAENILIYNLLGQKIDEIQVKTLGSGAQKVKWQNAGKHAAGTYVAKLISQDKKVQTLKFTKLQ